MSHEWLRQDLRTSHSQLLDSSESEMIFYPLPGSARCLCKMQSEMLKFTHWGNTVLREARSPLPLSARRLLKGLASVWQR